VNTLVSPLSEAEQAQILQKNGESVYRLKS